MKDLIREFAEIAINQPGMTDECKQRIRDCVRNELGIDPDTLALGGEYWTDERRRQYERIQKQIKEIFEDPPKKTIQ